MNTAYKKVPTYKDGKWSYTTFEDKKSWIYFLRDQFKTVGKYRLRNTKLWQEKGLGFIKNKVYTDLPKNSKGYHDFWLQEGVKCERGVIYHSKDEYGDDLVHYVTGYYYFYLNYYLIVIKHENNKEFFPERWDLDFHTFLYLERCFVEGKFAACNKRRQTGWSYKMASIIMCDLWFKKAQIIKMFSRGAKYVEDLWNMCATNRNHLLTHTGWTRQFWTNSKKELEWHMIWKAQEAGRDVEIGRNNKLTAINTKTSATNLVGGRNTLIISEESGVDSNLMQNIGYINDSIRQGEVITGKLILGGSVGELKDCEGLREITYNPKDYSFLSVPDLEDPTKDRVLFIPVQWNYIHPIYENDDVPDDEKIIIDIIRCYDEDGNSDIPKAKKLIEQNREKKKKQNPSAYALYCSQNPTTLDELYQSRESTVFDPQLITKQKLFLEESWEDQTAKLIEENGVIKHEYVKQQIVRDLPLKTDSFREGSVIIREPPIKNPRPFMYFAGVDPVKTLLGKGESLFSIHIYLNPYEENGTLKGGYFVAWYTGRYFDDNDTMEIGRKLIKYYNAATTCESDIDSFINYMKSFNEEHYLLKRKQIPIIKDLVPNSNISGDEYGLRMNTGGNSSRVKKHGLQTLKTYTEEILDIQKDAFGQDIVKRGIERIYDRMLLKEMEMYSDTLNCDRLISTMLALLTAKCYENNKVIQKITTQTVKSNEQPKLVNNQFINRFKLGNGLLNRHNQFTKRLLK